MPTKKQRRRNQKARRHEYEYVYVDDDGNEVEVDPTELRADKENAREPRAAKSPNKKPAERSGSGRKIDPPSWRRSGKRALILGPLMIIALMLFNQDLPISQQ